MKFKKIIVIAWVMTTLIAGAGFVQAQPGGTVTSGGNAPATNPPGGSVTSGGTQTKTFALTNPLKGIDSVGALLNKFIEIVSYLLILAAVLMIVYTGLKLILARGNPEELKEQGKRLGYILIGVALVIGARVIITVVINTLQATGTVDPRVIQSTDRALRSQ
jgi:hypothetical protein